MSNRRNVQVSSETLVSQIVSVRLKRTHFNTTFADLTFLSPKSPLVLKVMFGIWVKEHTCIGSTNISIHTSMHVEHGFCMSSNTNARENLIFQLLRPKYLPWMPWFKIGLISESGGAGKRHPIEINSSGILIQTHPFKRGCARNQASVWNRWPIHEHGHTRP